MGFGKPDMNGADMVFAIYDGSAMTIKDYNGGASHTVSEDSINDITKVSHFVTSSVFKVVFQRKLNTVDFNNHVLLNDGITSTSIINSIKTSTSISHHDSRCGSATSVTLEEAESEDSHNNT